MTSSMKVLKLKGMVISVRHFLMGNIIMVVMREDLAITTPLVSMAIMMEENTVLIIPQVVKVTMEGITSSIFRR